MTKIFEQVERERVAVEQELKIICAALGTCAAQTGFSVAGVGTVRVQLTRPSPERADLLRQQRAIVLRRDAIYRLWATLRQTGSAEA